PPSRHNAWQQRKPCSAPRRAEQGIRRPRACQRRIGFHPARPLRRQPDEVRFWGNSAGRRAYLDRRLGARKQTATREQTRLSVRSGRVTAGAEARYRDGLIGTRGGEVHALSDQCRLRNCATLLKAVEQSAQSPQIVGMDLGARQRPAEAEIFPIDGLDLCRLPLLEQKRTERMADRLHPTPRLDTE